MTITWDASEQDASHFYLQVSPMVCNFVENLHAMNTHHIIRYIIAAAAALGVSGAASAARDYRYHCGEDTVFAQKAITELSATENLGKRIVAAAHMLEGIPLAASVENDSVGTLMVNFHSFDNLDFITSVMALARSTGMQGADWRTYASMLENVGRMKGEDKGFASKLKYGSQWIVDNIYRGNIKDMTEYFEGSTFKTKTLDHFTRNRDLYPALADSATYEEQRMVEMGFYSHKIPHVKKQTINNRNFSELLKDGDIIMLLPKEPDYDLYDVGVVEIKEDGPHLIHLSREAGKVTADEYPLSRLFKLESQHFYGFRFLRPEE